MQCSQGLQDGTPSPQLEVATCNALAWNSDHSLKSKLEAAGLYEKRCGTARVLVYNFPTELKPWPVLLKETSAKDTEEALNEANDDEKTDEPALGALDAM